MRLEFFTLKICCAEHSSICTAYPTRNDVSYSRIYFARFIVYVRESHCISKHWIEDHSDKLRVHSRFPRINGAPFTTIKDLNIDDLHERAYANADTGA